MKTITLTDEQADLLSIYILISTKYRTDEVKACEELAQLNDDSGEILFPEMLDDAIWWRKMHRELNLIRDIIDDAPSKPTQPE